MADRNPCIDKKLNHVGTITLETDRLILRRLTIDDAENVYNNWTSDSEVSKYMRWQPHRCIEETVLTINDWINVKVNQKVYHLTTN